MGEIGAEGGELPENDVTLNHYNLNKGLNKMAINEDILSQDTSVARAIKNVLAYRYNPSLFSKPL